MSVFCFRLKSLFPFRLACHIFKLADKHSIAHFATYIPTHPNVEAIYVLWGRLPPKLHLLYPSIAEGVLQLWGQLEVDLLVPSCTKQCQHYYTLENLLSVGALGLNPVNHP